MATGLNDHMRDVGLVFDRLIEAGFTVSPKKVFCGMREVPYLGYLVGAYGTRPNPERTKALFDMAFEQVRTNAAAAARFATGRACFTLTTAETVATGSGAAVCQRRSRRLYLRTGADSCIASSAATVLGVAGVPHGVSVLARRCTGTV